MTKKHPQPPVKKPWLLIMGATVVVSCLIGTSVLFSSSESAAAIAEDAAVQVRVQEMIGAISVSRAILSEALIFGVAYQDDKISEATFHNVLDEANALLDDLDAQRSALNDVLSDAIVTQALNSYADAGSIQLADLTAAAWKAANGATPSSEQLMTVSSGYSWPSGMSGNGISLPSGPE